MSESFGNNTYWSVRKKNQLARTRICPCKNCPKIPWTGKFDADLRTAYGVSFPNPSKIRLWIDTYSLQIEPSLPSLQAGLLALCYRRKLRLAHKSRESVNREHGRQARLQVIPLSKSPSCVM